jgi:hypothetical protein
MNYQAIRAAVENPLLTAFNALVPPVPVYFDNITATPTNATTEHVKVNVTFGLTTDPTLTTSLDNVRGALVIRVFSEKGRGPARNQTLINTALTAIETLNNTAKTTTGVYFRLGQINGPLFSATEDSPLFAGRLEVSYTAAVLS